MYIELENIIHIVSVGIASFGIVLLSQRPNLRALRLLLILHVLINIFNFLEETKTLPLSILITPCFSLAFGPAFYLFVRSFLDKRKILCLRDIWHFILPFCSVMITEYPQLILALGTLSELIYLGFSFALLASYHKLSKETRSDAEQLKLSWLITVIIVYCLMAVQDHLRVNLQPHLQLELLIYWYRLALVGYLLLVAYIIYRVVLQTDLFEASLIAEEAGLDIHNTGSKSDIDESVFRELDQKIKMDHLYRKPKLSLSDLAEATGLHSKQISESINRVAGESFCDYINRYRVDEFCDRISQAEHHQSSLLELAFSSGFNSKSSFNAVFKRYKGMTPSQFAKES